MRALVLAATLLLAAPAGAAAPAPGRLQVVAREFTLTLSRQRLPAGAVAIEFVNLGMDPHDLRLQRIGGARIYGTPVVDPEGRKELRIPRLLAGRYRLWCAVDNHKMRGMTATLRVVGRG